MPLLRKLWNSADMVNGKFIRCCACDAIHHVTPFDKAPRFSHAAGAITEIPSDDWRQFMGRHAGHRLEPLKTTGESYSRDGSAMDPMGESFIEVTNGREQFLLRRTRISIDDPVAYEIAQGRLTDGGVTVEIQAAEIRKEMKMRFVGPAGRPLDDTSIDRFIQLFGEVVAAIDPRAIEFSEYSHCDVATSYGLLNASAIEALWVKCAPCFSSGDLESLRRFVESHRFGCDVMTLRMRRNLTVAQPSWS